MKTIHVIQDGGWFYDDKTGFCLFESSLIVKDCDTDAAIAAKSEFLDWTKCNDIIVIWEN